MSLARKIIWDVLDTVSLHWPSTDDRNFAKQDIEEALSLMDEGKFEEAAEFIEPWVLRCPFIGPIRNVFAECLTWLRQTARDEGSDV